MKTTFLSNTFMGFLIISLLAILSAQCNPTEGTPSEGPTPTPLPESSTLAGPGGMQLTLEGDAVGIAPEIQMEMLAEEGPTLENTPFEVASRLYRVALDGQAFNGGITMAVPLFGEVPPDDNLVHYAALVLTGSGAPVLVGAAREGEMIHFPVIGSGDYQVLQVAELDVSVLEPLVFQPLSVPSYPQMTPSWCSTTALTDLAGYHEGTWPAGGLSSIWGESANWYLAGLGGQAFNHGYFFHWLLEAGGYTVPGDVKQSFSNGNAQVIIWDWRSWKINTFPWNSEHTFLPDQLQSELNFTNNVLYANMLFNFFKAYVEKQVWGQLGDRRPVAWGSSLAGHSRVITGSDGTNFYFNNPSSGSWNDTKSWEAYRQEVLDSLTADKQEVIDTAVFYAPVRPAEDRRAVLWLLQADSGQPGSIVLKSGAEETPAANWMWDGAFGHQYGYYYNDLAGDLPTDPTLGVSFKATTPYDFIEYGYTVRSISEGSFNYEVQTRVFKVSDNTQQYYGENQVSVETGQKVQVFPAGAIPISNLPAGLYYLKFTMMMNGVVEDVKYVYFQLADHALFITHIGRLKAQSNCRVGPGTTFGVAAMLETGQPLTLVGIDPNSDWGQFDVMLDSLTIRCWVNLERVELSGTPNVPVVTVLTPTVTPPPAAINCSDYKTLETCNAHPECTWAPATLGPGYCKAK